MQGLAQTQRFQAAGGLLSGLVARLVLAQRRSLFAGVGEFAILSVLYALAVFCVLQLAHALLGEYAPSFGFVAGLAPNWLVAWRPSPVPEHVVLAFATGVIVLIASPLIVYLQRPGIDSMARAADRRFTLDECMSTALEVAYAPVRATGVVIDALLETADARTAKVDPSKLVPYGLPRLAAGIPILVLVAALVMVSPPPPLLQDAMVAMRAVDARRPSLQQELQQDTVANLRAIAAILKQDGETRADPGIQAIARALEQLGAEAEANPAMTGEALTQALDRLQALATEAYTRAGEATTGPRNYSRLIAGLNEQATNRSTGPKGNDVKRALPGQARDDIAPPELAGVLTNRDFAGLDDFRDLVAPGTAIGEAATNRPGGGDGVADAVGVADGYDDDFFAGGKAADGGEAAGAGGKLIGGADGAAPGDFAGIGTQGLFGRPGEVAKYGVAGELLLENPGLGNGRRIRFDLAPDTAVRETTAKLTGGQAAWRPKVEAEVTRADLPASARDFVSRYFDALRVEAGK